MLVVHQFLSDREPCAYLQDRCSRIEYSYTPLLSPEEYEGLMDQGYRKFGALVFRPACDACRECRPIRIPVARFRPDRSQRRAWKRNSYLRVQLGPPSPEEQRIDLYNRYHSWQTSRKGWPSQVREPADYAFSFVHNPLPAIEISLWDGEKLRAVVITEITPNTVSGVYHYHDPDLSRDGVGTYCMLRTIELARSMGREFAYFGYYVEGCSSLAYKAGFKPCQILGVDGVWRESVGEPNGATSAPEPAGP